MSIVDFYARVIGNLSQESLSDFIRVESLEDSFTLVLKDGTLASMIRVEGALRSPGDAELADMVERLRISLSPYLANPGHVVDISFNRDAAAARQELEVLIEKTGRSARSLGLDIDDVLEEREAVLSQRMVAETSIVTLFTRPDVLSAEEASDESIKLKKRMAAMPVMAEAHSLGKTMDMVFTRHQSLTAALHSAFKDVGQLSRVLTVSEALQEMRAALYPSTAPFKRDWEPRLPAWSNPAKRGSRVLVQMPESPNEMGGRDFSHLFDPAFDLQLATEDAFVENSRTVRIGDSLFSGFDMTLAPETLPDFNDLVRDITAKNVNLPWRCSIRLESGGLQGQALKNTFLSIFAFASPTNNRRIKEAIEYLRDLDGRSDTIVRFRMSFATWTDVGRATQLRRNTQTLIGAVQRWGNSRADGISGDQLATVISTVPGATMSSTAPVAAAPLSEALCLCPIARQASPWPQGSVLLRTDDGKTWPYQPGSSKQTTWVTLLVGTPGSDKSVMMKRR